VNLDHLHADHGELTIKDLFFPLSGLFSENLTGFKIRAEMKNTWTIFMGCSGLFFLFS